MIKLYEIVATLSLLLVRTEGHGEIREKFGENVKQVKAVDALEKLPHPQLKELLSQVNGFEQMNRLSDLVPDISTVKSVKFETNYIVVDGKTIIDDARLITNDDLAVKVRDNPGQFKDINNSLSQVTDADKLQADLLNDIVRNFFVELNQSGKSNVSANEQMERAKLGERNKYTDVQQILDYYESGDIYKTLSEGPYQELLDTTTGKKNQKLKYEQELKDRDKANADREKHPTESKKKLEELKTKLDLDISVKKLGNYIKESNLKSNPFNDKGAYDLLHKAAKNYIEYGDSTNEGFLEYLKSSGELKNIRWKSENLKAKIDQALRGEEFSLNTEGSGKPEWLKNFEKGNEFNKERSQYYPFNEVYIEYGDGYVRVDSYNPVTGEIISRKFTQLGEISEEAAIGYINEIPKKYPPGAKIADVPSNKVGGNKGIFDSGTELKGQMILEVPVQNKPIPQKVLDAAKNADVIIRDVNGKIYK